MEYNPHLEALEIVNLYRSGDNPVKKLDELINWLKIGGLSPRTPALVQVLDCLSAELKSHQHLNSEIRKAA